MTSSIAVVCPGDRLKPANEFAAGEGTYVKNGHIHSSTAGFEDVTKSTGVDEENRPRVSVRRSGQQSIVPEPGNIVTCKVTRIMQRMAKADILCVGSKPLGAAFSGIIRSQDVRSTEIDKVVMFDCFRPGDLVRAEVISLGDSRSYYLSTARNELGVVSAKSLAGVAMVPVSWQEMQCPETGATEKRKVAKTAPVS